jgi:altronate dehydratase
MPSETAGERHDFKRVIQRFDSLAVWHGVCLGKTVKLPTEFDLCARLADPADNVAIATRQIEAGEEVRVERGVCRLPHTVLLGHRFAIRPIPCGSELMSWGRPFGEAVVAINPGEYVCNDEILKALAFHETGTLFPSAPNFRNRIVRYVLDETGFEPAPPNDPVDKPATFFGYRRPGGRGIGTRNFIVVVGTSSRTGSFVRRLCKRLQPLVGKDSSIDGIVPLVHTEGGDPTEPNNRIEILRALAGCLIHPNVAAVLAVDYGLEPLNNARLWEFLVENRYPIEDVPHRFYSIRGPHAVAFAEAESQIREWLPGASSARRTEEPVAGLSIALQCGGSDAFSGISGNPLVGAVGHKMVRHGGRVCLTETDELIGAENYVLARVSCLETAHHFLEAVERFKERLGWHGVTVEANPSTGNKLRGLYNVTLKSLGAAAKKSPLTRLDYVTDYAERMMKPGFTFMDGPGSDLEGITGQIATGCNLIVFVTGHGSVTNFPFVPTIKVVTTTERFQLLSDEMDVNAGRYLEGEPMDSLRDETFERVREVASGERSKGERAGHSQAMIWRNWRQTDRSDLDRLKRRSVPEGRPVSIRKGTIPPLEEADGLDFVGFRVGDGWAIDRVGLILPTSMCSSEVARLAAVRLNAKGTGAARGIRRFAALGHTEGCGSTGTFLYQTLARSYAGYLVHPCVVMAVVLEHGCEKLSSDHLRQTLREMAIDEERFGWASVQLDGGMEKTLAGIEDWFDTRSSELEPAKEERLTADKLRLGLLTSGPPSARLASVLAWLAQSVAAAGGSVLLPLADPLLETEAFRRLPDDGEAWRPTLAHGEIPEIPGMHIMDTESENWVENTTALGAGGAEIFVGGVSDHPHPGHPFLPVLQIVDGDVGGRFTDDEIDLFLGTELTGAVQEVRRLVVETAGRVYRPKYSRLGLIDFQFTRGHLGVTS